MNCPKCSAPMIHHASKVIEPRDDAERRLYDTELGGVVLERHQCPKCGATVTSFSEPPRNRP